MWKGIKEKKLTEIPGRLGRFRGRDKNLGEEKKKREDKIKKTNNGSTLKICVDTHGTRLGEKYQRDCVRWVGGNRGLKANGKLKRWEGCGLDWSKGGGVPRGKHRREWSLSVGGRRGSILNERQRRS